MRVRPVVQGPVLPAPDSEAVMAAVRREHLTWDTAAWLSGDVADTGRGQVGGHVAACAATRGSQRRV